MADLVTHFSLGYFLGRPVSDPKRRLLFYVGCVLPDLCFKGALIGFQSAIWFAEPTHSLFGSFLICYGFSLLFQPVLRRTAFLCLWLGYLSHIAVDLFKDNLGTGSVLLLFPSMKRYEIPCYGPEASVDWMPYWIGAVLVVEWFRPTLFIKRAVPS